MGTSVIVSKININKKKILAGMKDAFLYRPMEQNREPRNKPNSLQSINIWQKRQEDKMEQKQPLQQMVFGDVDGYIQKNETRSVTYAIHKNKLKMDKRLKYQS